MDSGEDLKNVKDLFDDNSNDDSAQDPPGSATAVTGETALAESRLDGRYLPVARRSLSNGALGKNIK